MIVAIDGPAGAGKSTVARLLARELGFGYLDTGAMYRAMLFAALAAETDLEDSEALYRSCQNAELEFSLEGIRFKGNLLAEEIRTPEISRGVKTIADHLGIRQLLVEKQRELAQCSNVVCEGRDQGTVAFPKADCKIFLTASSGERAKRRQQELSDKGRQITLEAIQQDQDERDHQDCQRTVGALQKAEDAIEFNTDGLSIQQVVEQLTAMVKTKIGARENSPCKES